MSKNIKVLIAILCCFAFVWMESPSILDKLQHTNAQAIFWTKSLVLIGAYLLLFLTLIFAAMSKAIIKYSTLVMVLFSSLIFDGYYLIAHKVIEYQEFVLLWQSRANLFDALKMYSTIGLDILPKFLILILGFVLMPPPPRKNRQILLFRGKFSNVASVFFSFSLICLTLLTCILREGAATNKLPSAFGIYGLLLAYGYDHLQNPYTYHYQAQIKKPIGQGEAKHIVLIVDESIRADYSPFKRRDKMQNWLVYDYGNATSYANSSAVSNILLRKGARYESLTKDFYENPLIWQYAHIAGYQTYLFDNQGGGMGHDYFDERERSMIDFNLSNLAYDDWEILKALSHLQEDQKTFTLVIKKGAHFPYDAYPKSFKPSFAMDGYIAKKAMREKYFYTLCYQSDKFWEEFAKLSLKEPTLVIYTSDHGQNLEDEEGLTHGSTQKPYKGEGIVPLVVLSNFDIPLLQKFKINGNKTSHFNIIPTILDAMGYDSKKLGYEGYNSSLFGETQEVGGFFYGIPFGYFGKPPSFKNINPQSF